jgi:hypothetical protein
MASETAIGGTRKKILLTQAPKGTHCVPYACQVQAHEPDGAYCPVRNV